MAQRDAVVQELPVQAGDDAALVTHDELAVVAETAQGSGFDAVEAAQFLQARPVRFSHSDDHALLGLAQPDFPGPQDDSPPAPQSVMA